MPRTRRTPNWFLEGHMNQSEGEFQDLQAARNYANSFARFKPHEYVGIVSAPYKKAEFEPDLLLVYGNPAQIDQLISGIMYRDGLPVTPQRAEEHASAPSYPQCKPENAKSSPHAPATTGLPAHKTMNSSSQSQRMKCKTSRWDLAKPPRISNPL